VDQDVQIKERQSGKAKNKIRNVNFYDKIFENVMIEGKELDGNRKYIIYKKMLKD
jgi:hypothetical protein